MKFTNRTNLPDALVRAIENDPYDKGDSDYTATSLIKPARMTALEIRHQSDLSEDVVDNLWRLYGQVAHGILERANSIDLAEKRLFSTFHVNGKDYKVSAQLDTLSLSNGVLSDFKFTTAYGFKADKDAKAEWIAQLNIQLELLRRNELDANKLQIIGLLRDWQINQAKAAADYPQAPIAVVDIPEWSREQTVSYIEMRIADHEEAKLVLPECSPGERWAKPDTWAVIKRGGKRAINGGVQLSQSLAEAISAKNAGTIVQYRAGASVRCADYCAVAQFCTQFQRLAAIKQTDAEESTSEVS